MGNAKFYGQKGEFCGATGRGFLCILHGKPLCISLSDFDNFGLGFLVAEVGEVVSAEGEFEERRFVYRSPAINIGKKDLTTHFKMCYSII